MWVFPTTPSPKFDLEKRPLFFVLRIPFGFVVNTVFFFPDNRNPSGQNVEFCQILK
jgi:hypothetical protein